MYNEQAVEEAFKRMNPETKPETKPKKPLTILYEAADADSGKILVQITCSDPADAVTLAAYLQPAFITLEKAERLSTKPQLKVLPE